MDGHELVLGQKEGVVFAQALPFRLDISQIVGIIPGDFLPVVAEVTLDAILSLHLKVCLLHLFEQGGVIPGGARVNP